MATLTVEKREGAGKYVSFNLRKTGRIPGVVYGRELKENINISIPLKEFVRILHRGERIIDLEIAGEKRHAIIKDVQHGTYDHEILHADFRQVGDLDKVHVNVPIELVGDAPGAAVGGVVEQSQFDVDIECVASKLPEKVCLDISTLQVNKVLYVHDLPRLDGVTYRTHADVAVTSCHRPHGEESAEGGAEEEEAQ